MAYSYTDYYRALRLIMRIDSLLVGIGLGLLLLIYPADLLTGWGFVAPEPAWPARLAGSSLLGMGVGFWLAAREQDVRLASVITLLISNGLVAGVLLAAYLQKELVHLSLVGRVLLIALFATCLAAVVIALPHLRPERQPFR